MTIDFKTCTVFGIVNARSLGDASNVILVHGTTNLCFINTSPLEAGIVIHPEEVHLEAGGKLVLVKGWVIGKITETNSTHFKIVFAQTSNGVQKIKNCVTSKGVKEREETLLTAEPPGAFEASSQTGEGEIVFTVAQTLMS